MNRLKTVGFFVLFGLIIIGIQTNIINAQDLIMGGSEADILESKATQDLQALTSSTTSVQLGEVTTAQANSSEWHTVTFPTPFTVSPVVVVSPVSFNFGQPTVVRVRNVTSTSFQFQLDEWDYLDGGHDEETVYYMAAEPGQHNLDGIQIEAGSLSTDHNWTTQSFITNFSSAPVVLAQTTTFYGPSAVNVRLRNVTTNDFEAHVQEEQGNDGAHAVEDIHYIALSTGTGSLNGLALKVGNTGNTVTDGWSTIDFGGTFTAPYFLSHMQTFNGSDPASLRYNTLTEQNVEVKVEEEQSFDTEVAHWGESVGWVVYASAPGIESVTFSESEQQAALDFWTDARMAEAEGIALPDDSVGVLSAGSPAQLNGLTLGPPYTGYYVNADPFFQTLHPYNKIGRLFFTTPNGLGSHCSASVIGPNMIVTAGHCVETPNVGGHNNFVFAPAYQANSHPNYGRFAGVQYKVSSEWTQHGRFDYDIAVIRLGRNSYGQTVHGAVNGHLGYSTIATSVQHLHSFGYPANISGGRYMIGCAGQSTQETGFLISMGCHMTQGSSGGPWIQNLNPYTNGGNIVISVVSHGKQTSERDKFYGPLFNAQNFTPLCEADPTDGWPGCHP